MKLSDFAAALAEAKQRLEQLSFGLAGSEDRLRKALYEIRPPTLGRNPLLVGEFQRLPRDGG